MKRIIAFLLCVMSVATVLCACGGKTHEKPEDGYFLTTDLNYATIGIVDGHTEERQVTDRVSKPKLKKFKTAEEAIEALKSKELDAIVLDGETAPDVLEGDAYLSEIAEILVDKKYYGAIFVTDHLKGDDFLLDMELGITDFRSNGEKEALYKKYIGTDLPDGDVEYNENDKYGRVLRVGVAEDNAPFSYKNSDGKYIGFDVEVANTIAKSWKATLEIYSYPRNKLLEAVEAGEVDIVFGRLTDADDKHENDWLIFTDPYFDASQKIIVRSEDAGKIAVK